MGRSKNTSMETDIAKTVLQKIQAGEIAKRSRLYFALQVGLIALLALVTFVLALFVLSFIIFSLHESREQLLLGFGQQGVVTFFALFPWLSLVLVLILLALLEWLLRNFRSGYRIPMLRIFLVLAAIAVAGSALVDFTPLHPDLLGLADHDSLPILGPAYEDMHDSHEIQGVYRGDITAIASTTFTCAHNDNDHDTDDGTWVVQPPPNFNMQSLYLGERVYVAGHPQPDGVIQAYGMHPF
jgi:hypothetical protein